MLRAITSVLTLILVTSAAHGYKESGGGDEYAQSFVSVGYYALEILKQSLTSTIDLAQLEKALLDTKVSSTDEKLEKDGQTVDALQFPGDKQILFNRAKWDVMATGERRAKLVLHEYLGIMRVDDTNYRVSAPIARLFSHEPQVRYQPRNQWGLGMDIHAYCHRRGGTADFPATGGPFGWRCVASSRATPVDFPELCREQYGTRIWGYGKYWDSNSLYCGPGSAHRNPWGPGIDPVDYCQQVHGFQHTAVLVSNDAYGWRCRGPGGDHSIHMSDACARQQGVNWALPGDVNNPGSWYCVFPK